MKSIHRLIACMLVLPILLLFLPQTALCAGTKTTAKADKKTITRHAPKVKASAEKAMTPEQAKAAKAQAKKKKPNWLLIGLGAAVVVGLAAAMGGGGGDGGKPGTKEEGDITVEW